MLRDRYEPMDVFRLVPALSTTIDPVIARLDVLLDDDHLFQTVKADLGKRYPQTACTGRPSTPVEVILRMLVIKHLYGWSYAQTEQWVSDSLVLRQFCRVYFARVPDDTTLIRWANLIQPATIHRLLDHVVDLARSLKVTRGRKLRIDGTVVATNIHHPVDSTLLSDGVRVLGRTLHKAKQVLQDVVQGGRDLFRDRTRTAKRQVQRIMDAARRRTAKAEADLHAAYQDLLATTETMVNQAQQVVAELAGVATKAAERVTTVLQHVLPQVEQVIDQTTRRVVGGETVPASEKLVSIFEPETAIIRKGKAGKPTEFGRVVWLDEVDGGIITRYTVLDGNPPEPPQVRVSVDHHRQRFGKPPKLLVGDRGTYSPDGEQYARDQGIQQVVLPKPGHRSQERIAHERQAWFRAGRNWRSGIEGRISALKRRHKLDRCRYHGTAGMERWVGWGILAHNLRTIATKTAHAA